MNVHGHSKHAPFYQQGAQQCRPGHHSKACPIPKFIWERLQHRGDASLSQWRAQANMASQQHASQACCCHMTARNSRMWVTLQARQKASRARMECKALLDTRARMPAPAAG